MLDAVYRDLGAMREHLVRVLDQHEPSMGSTTSNWHNVLTSRVLFDREGHFACLQGLACRPYPVGLARAIVAKNHPLIHDSFGVFGGQILKAASRGDRIGLNHRTAAFLASYFDVAFAANRARIRARSGCSGLPARYPSRLAAWSRTWRRFFASAPSRNLRAWWTP